MFHDLSAKPFVSSVFCDFGAAAVVDADVVFKKWSGLICSKLKDADLTPDIAANAEPIEEYEESEYISDEEDMDSETIVHDLADVEDLGNVKNGTGKGDSEENDGVMIFKRKRKKDGTVERKTYAKEMLTPSLRANLEKQGLKFLKLFF